MTILNVLLHAHSATLYDAFNLCSIVKPSVYFTKHIHITLLLTGKISIYIGCAKCTGIPVCVASCQKVVQKKKEVKWCQHNSNELM